MRVSNRQPVGATSATILERLSHMSTVSAMSNDKQQKREARQLKERAEAAMQAGDYKSARELDLKVAELAPESDLGAQAKKEAQNLKTDPWIVYGGLGALLLYLIAWAYALF